MALTKVRRLAIRHDILDWYRTNRRDLPWRRTNDPYAILVSEIMLQQTQVNRVMPKYRAFLSEFPTVRALAAASPAAVIRAWKGLGYNRRALNLQRAARVIANDYQGHFPRSVEALQQLPGIGRYTAGAVATFAFGAITPAVDTNVRQFIDALIPSRVYRTEPGYEAIAKQLIPADRPGEWLHAMMDYSSLVLRPAGSRPKKRAGTLDPEPFVGSNRYLRGQVIDRLRERPYAEAELYRRIAKPVAVARSRFDQILADLTRDGLTVRESRTYALVGDNQQ